MSNVFVDGYATYGLGDINTNDQKYLALLSGRYASLNHLDGRLGTLPWAPADSDIYFSAPQSILGYKPTGLRTVLPVASTTVVASFYGALESLPTVTKAAFLMFSDGSNDPLVGLGVTPTGALFIYQAVYDSGGPALGFTIIAQSDGPILQAQSAAHIEIKLVCGTSSSNTVEVQVNGVSVISASGLSMSWDPTHAPTNPFPNANACACVSLFPDITYFGGGAQGPRVYIGNLIIRDGNGGVNDDIEGDRRVATLFVNADDAAHQGWLGQPYRRFGAGILDLTYNNAATGSGDTSVVAGPSSQLDIGSGDFTIEGQWRFQQMPILSGKAVMYSHWDEAHNTRECELYVGGPSLEGGNLVFRISTDGTGGTITEVISWPVQFVIGHWYHVAIARVSDVTRLFINGVLQGVGVADSHAYFAGGSAGAYAALGSDTNNGGGVNGAGFDGWVDEFRLTVGVGRYTATFAPPTGNFPTGGGDADWANVAWLSGWDSGTFLDESSFARSLRGNDNAKCVLPPDGDFNFETINKGAPPFDDTFIEASLLAASGALTFTGQPANNESFRLGTEDGTVAAVYTWKTTLTGSAWEVKIGANAAASINNAVAAINAGSGAGSVYGTGTTANNDASAASLGGVQLVATALAPGAAGNAIVSTSSTANAAWGGGDLSGGADIPGYSQFGYARLPSNVTTVDSITLLSRSWKTDAGVCTVKTSFIGGGGGVELGANVSVTTAPAFYSTLIEADPDTSGPITPTTVTNGKIRVDRTT